ncbi:hypothetical protein [Cyanobium gracile]|uniref:Uncharacterized protein n=1 Tax=Cyanobium gracile (strain ATCC 27147 / PCC 6307) TaxID=292564 RepID=K9P5B7_CYAGP|nr:hypothetical protein [Cyanobium gracile]AFY27759.1 hypothetical protein Cyagr_0568 [Cyanobium gracile PCC 6307]
MGLFDRLFGSRAASVSKPEAAAKAKPKAETFFLDPEASSSLGDVKFMKRSNTIRHTFPGNADSPGEKEMVAEVASMEARVEKMTPGLAGIQPTEKGSVNLTGGIPKPVKKTFAQQMSAAELGQRMKGAAVTPTNLPGGPAAAKQQKEAEAQGQPAGSQAAAKPGTTDPFRSMVRDLEL